MLRLYIFDMGGVLSSNTNVAPLIAKHLNLNPARFDELVKEDFHQMILLSLFMIHSQELN